MKCAAVLHIVSRIRVNGAVPPLLLSVLWCGQEQLNLLCVVTSSYSCVVFMYIVLLSAVTVVLSSCILCCDQQLQLCCLHVYCVVISSYSCVVFMYIVL
jgi:hypothetical protein